MGACESNIPQFLVTFTEDFSNLPMLTATSSTNAISIDEQTGGTKEESLCAGRGICDFGTGMCKCSANFKTSNGLGAAGTRGECGFATGTITACPGEISCSGHGVCAGNPTYVCQCSNGWMGAIVPYVSAHRVQHGLVHQPLLILHMIYKNALTLVYVNVQKANAFVASGGMVLHANTN